MDLFQGHIFAGLAITPFEDLIDVNMCETLARESIMSYSSISTFTQLFQLLKRAWMTLVVHGNNVGPTT